MVKFPFPISMGFLRIMLFLLFIMLVGHSCGQRLVKSNWNKFSKIRVPPDKKDEWKPCNWKNVSNDPKKPSGSAKIFFTEDNCET